MVAPLPNVTTCGKDSTSREQNKINQYVFYAEAKRKEFGNYRTLNQEYFYLSVQIFEFRLKSHFAMILFFD